eukprot:3773121-Pleurochrysis_carterae.AAC.2
MGQSGKLQGPIFLRRRSMLHTSLTWRRMSRFAQYDRQLSCTSKAIIVSHILRVSYFALAQRVRRRSLAANVCD